MDKRMKFILLLFILILIVIIMGNYIHLFFIQKGINYEAQDTDFKINVENLTILIEVDKNQLHIVDLISNKFLKTYEVATGKIDTPTPLGTFKIIEKARWGEGFGSRWLELNVPWGIYGIHGTNKPSSIGSNVSAGCIRMRNKDVEEVFDIISDNTVVHITKGEYGPLNNGFRELKPGDRGSDVLEVQKRLKIKGYYLGNLDGIYGEDMKKSLLQYLKDNNMLITDKIDFEIYNKLDIVLME